MSTMPRGLGSRLQGPRPWDQPSGNRDPVQVLHCPCARRRCSRQPGPVTASPHTCRSISAPRVNFSLTHIRRRAASQNNLGFKFFGLNILKGTYPPAQGAKGCFRGS